MPERVQRKSPSRLLLRRPALEIWSFTLFISSQSQPARGPEQVLRSFCEKFLGPEKIEYFIEVIDITKRLDLALQMKVLATPTLIIETPYFEKRLTGEFNEVQLIRFCFIDLNRMREFTTRSAPAG